MKELSVAVLGSGRWAETLTVLLKHNQAKYRGHIRRVTEYKPSLEPAAGSSAGSGASASLGPISLRPTHRAEKDDATMMGMTADSFAALGGPPAQKPLVRSQSDDATMMHMTADSFAALTAPTGSGQKPAMSSSSDDATMMHMTADSFAALTAPKGGPAKAAVQSGTDDATMMALTADALAAVAASAPGAGKVPKATLRAGSEDATMMHLTAERLLGVTGQRVNEEAALRELGSADLILLAVPAATVRTVLRQVRSVLRPQQMLVHCIGGFFPPERELGQPASLISTIIRQETPLTRIGALAGPALPEDLESWNPAALVCGSATEMVVSSTRQVLGCTTLRIYGNNDLIGVEVAGAMSCTVALGSGMCDALEFGLSARSMLVSRAAAEIARLGVCLGGQERTFLGLAGFGNFMLASEGRDSIDYQLGRRLAAGGRAAQAMTQLGLPCPSVHTIRDAHVLAQSYGLRAPILTTLYRLLFEDADRNTTITDLLDDPNYAE